MADPTAVALSGRRTPSDRGAGRGPVLPGLAVLVGVVVGVRLLVLRTPLSPDEAGFSMLAGQWRPGDSLYGDYWVDRPPGLVLLFGLADHLGGAVGLRLLGVVAAVASVLAAAALGSALGRGMPARASTLTVLAPATVVTCLVSSFFTDVTEVDGELLALPFLLAGLALLAVAHGRTLRGRSPVPAALVAGVCATAAVSVKQDLVDVALAATVLAGGLVVAGRRRDATRVLLPTAAAALVALVALLAYAATRGTSPAALYDAVVTFRARAGAVIADEASPATDARALHLLLALLATGAPLLLLLLGRLRWRRGDPAAPWTWVALALLAWEAFAVVAGGSYWWHYLLGLVPGLALLTALGTAPARRPRRLPRVHRTLAGWLLVPLVTSLLGSTVWLAVHPPRPTAAVAGATTYLETHAEPGQTGVVLYGDPSMLQAAGLSSPYPYLWSLPTRVRDQDLALLDGVLRGPDAPTWVVVPTRGATTWGVTPVGAARVDRTLAERWTEVHRSGDLAVLERATS